MNHTKKKLKLSDIYVAPSKLHGLGVFASRDIKCGELIEEAHLLVLGNRDWGELDDVLSDYVFSYPSLDSNWKKTCDELGGITPNLILRPAVVLGFGMIYNHSDTNNVNFKIHKTKKIVSFTTNTYIMEGEELTIDYGEDYWSERKDKK